MVLDWSLDKGPRGWDPAGLGSQWLPRRWASPGEPCLAAPGDAGRPDPRHPALAARPLVDHLPGPRAPTWPSTRGEVQAHMAAAWPSRFRVNLKETVPAAPLLFVLQTHSWSREAVGSGLRWGGLGKRPLWPLLSPLTYFLLPLRGDPRPPQLRVWALEHSANGCLQGEVGTQCFQVSPASQGLFSLSGK